MPRARLEVLTTRAREVMAKEEMRRKTREVIAK